MARQTKSDRILRCSIFNLIERAQFALNSPIYQPSEELSVPGFDPRTGQRLSLLEYVLRETEQLHGKLRRYSSPDEHAFYPSSLPPLVMRPISFEPILHPCSTSININEKLLRVYTNELLPGLTAPGDDQNYGSASMLDVSLLQALSKRIHYGMFVAEAKFVEKRDEYTRLIKARDTKAIMALLTDVAVEERVMARVALKAATFGQDINISPQPSNNASGSSPQDPKPSPSQGTVPLGIGQASSVNILPSVKKLKVRPELVADLYKDHVMPLTKEVELEYLLRRLD